MKKHLIICSTLIVLTAVYVYWTIYISIADSSYVLAGLNLMIAPFVVLGGLLFGLLNFKQKTTRYYSLLVALLAVFPGLLPRKALSEVWDNTQNHLEEIHAQLIKKGPPFPADISSETRPKWLFSHGYWVSEDRQQFEVYYRVDSNAWKLSNTDRNWTHRRPDYSGPRDESSLAETKLTSSSSSREAEVLLSRKVRAMLLLRP